MITPRIHHESILAKDALREIFLSRGKKVNEALALQFIKTVGVFPPGAFVRLSNGEIAVVIKRGKDGTAPTVSSIVSPRGGRYARPFRRNRDDEKFKIREMIPPDGNIQPNLRTLWGYH
jgi:hypothetical protein